MVIPVTGTGCPSQERHRRKSWGSTEELEGELAPVPTLHRGILAAPQTDRAHRTHHGRTEHHGLDAYAAHRA
jgi:hypothetical protein